MVFLGRCVQRRDAETVPLVVDIGALRNEQITGYPATPTASVAGVPGEVSEDGAIQRMSVLPKPYQKPYPRCFVAAMKSLETISFCSKHGFIPSYFMKDDDMASCFNMYVDEGRDHGHDYVLGQNQNIVRWCHVVKDKAEFERKLLAYDLDIYTNFYGPFLGRARQNRQKQALQRDSGQYLEFGHFSRLRKSHVRRG